VTAAQANVPGGKPDRSAVIDFDSRARVVSPLADPSQAKFDGIDSSGDTNIGAGVNLALDELARNGNKVRDRAGVVVLTDGQDGNPAVLTKALERARGLGVRVQFGFLSPPRSPLHRRAGVEAAQARQPTSVQKGILETGGVFSTINSAEAQRAFIELVERAGPTNLNDPNGTDDDGGVSPEVAVTARLGDPADVDTFTYAAPPGRRVTAVLRPLEGQSLALRGTRIEDLRELGPAAQDGVTVAGLTRRPGTLAFEVRGQAGATGLYEIALTQQGVDAVRNELLPSRISCGDAPAPAEVTRYALGGDLNEHIVCGPGPDVIVPGKGSDTSFGGPGDDVFVVGRKDVRKRATDKIDGGDGYDVVEIAARRPKGKLKRVDGARVVPLNKGFLRIRNVERFEFTR
jgi:hypothetical protein